MKVLLTSTGLETEEIKEKFLSMLNKEAAYVKALFIPTAAIDPGAIAVLPKCMNDLQKCGIQDNNIIVYDLHKGMKIDELNKYDVVYLCGGNTQYLLERINDTEFNYTLMDYISGNGFVVGVSAGSIIFGNNMKENLGLLDMTIDVHCEEGDKRGKLLTPVKGRVRLTNSSALVIFNKQDELEIIGN